MARALRALRAYWRAYLGLAILVALDLTSLPSRTLFHTLAEMLTVAVAGCTFIIAWDASRLYSNSYLLVLGVGSGFVALLTLLHALSYRGFAAFPQADPALPAQLWIASRALLSFTLFAAPLLLGRAVRLTMLVATYAAATALLICTIFVWRVFPPVHIGAFEGLTPFEIGAEYVICSAMVIALVLVWLQHQHFDLGVLRYLTAAILLAIASELAFASYVSTDGAADIVGHTLTILSFYCLYIAIVRTALVDPLRLLFRDLKQHEEELEAAQETQEQMTEFLVHDLRSPLTTVTAAVTALRRARPGSIPSHAYQELLDAAQASVSWLLTLTNALLDASRLHSGAMPLAPAPVAPTQVVSPAVEQVSLWADLGGMKLHLELPPDDTYVFADHDLTVRVLVNLLSNAIKYSPPGSAITIRAVPNGNTVAFSVADQGAGIPPEWADKVFERFAVGPRAAGVAASGLGLHFCKLAVEAQGGRISLASTPGQGTTITFTLPTHPSPDHPPVS